MRAFAIAFSLLLLAPATAAAKVVHFRGEEIRVPASWPVYRLAEHPQMCVRMDRRAVYLGAPAANPRCPARAVGRQRAILVEPDAPARASAVAPVATPPAAGSTVFTGLGFDACTAPSLRTMAAWGASPYRAIGVYVGGLNRGCSQPNLTSSWVATQIAAGWHLIPTYVGLQSPTSSCGSCAKLSSARASTQGAEAAEDAVAQMMSIGIGPGNPIYFDMESYLRATSATRATLTFLGAWTTQLHALGYTSGVYSSSSSGIADIAREIGTGYALPDDLWIANWNGQANTLDPYVPSTAWSRQERLHQYRGGHDEIWGGVKINIDNNYLDGATVGAVAPPPSLPPLTVSQVKPAAATVQVRVRCGWPEGETCPGQILMRSHVRLPRGPIARGVETRVVRIAIARRAFRLAGGRTHTFRIALNARGRPLYEARAALKAQLLVAIPGARHERAVTLRRAR
jgi:hypothetical protein